MREFGLQSKNWANYLFCQVRLRLVSVRDLSRGLHTADPGSLYIAAGATLAIELDGEDV